MKKNRTVGPSPILLLCTVVRVANDVTPYVVGHVPAT
jgi:hypothetical protein